MQTAIRTVAQSAARADAIFIPDGADTAPAVVQALGAAGGALRGIERSPDCSATSAYVAAGMT